MSDLPTGQPTAGQHALAIAVSARINAGDTDGRILADLLVVVAAVISDLPRAL
jgi:hypothetical protein